MKDLLKDFWLKEKISLSALSRASLAAKPSSIETSISLEAADIKDLFVAVSFTILP